MYKFQLPISWYFDPAIYELEQRYIFSTFPQYLGHKLTIPNIGDYYVPEVTDESKILVHSKKGVVVLDNICRHRQGTLLKGRGNLKHIICPTHHWTYDLHGKLLVAPYFPKKPCLNLRKTEHQSWNGLLFSTKQDMTLTLKNLDKLVSCNFDDYQFYKVDITEYDFNWKNYLDVCLESYHFKYIHPGLSHYIDDNNMEGGFGETYSVYTAKFYDYLRRPGSPAYQKFHQELLRISKERLPPYAINWIVHYPNISIECFPYSLSVDILIPRNPNQVTIVTEQYYAKKIIENEPAFIEAHQSASDETKREDIAVCYRLQKGRFALYNRRMNESGPYQTYQEIVLKEFHKFLWHKIAPHFSESEKTQ